MTIEVKQLLIKSSVLSPGDQESGPDWNTEEIINEILAYVLEECRQMVAEMLQKERER